MTQIISSVQAGLSPTSRYYPGWNLTKLSPWTVVAVVVASSLAFLILKYLFQSPITQDSSPSRPLRNHRVTLEPVVPGIPLGVACFSNDPDFVQEPIQIDHLPQAREIFPLSSKRF